MKNHRVRPALIKALLPLLFFMSLGCAKKPATHAKIQVQFDQTLMGTGGVVYKNSSQSNSSGPNWGLADPQSLSQIHCYGIFIYGPEPELQNSVCSNELDQQILFGPRAGFYPISEPGTIEVLAGVQRTIYLVGMSSSDGTCPTNFENDTEIEESNFSNLFIIGQTQVDLLAGENIVEILLQANFSDSHKIKDCDFFEDSEPGPLQMSEGNPYDFNQVVIGTSSSHTFTLTNTSSEPISLVSFPDPDTPFDYLGGSGFPGTGGTCTATLAAQSNCTIVLSFAPSTTATSFDTFSLSYDHQGVSYLLERNLTGQGAMPASLTYSITGPYDFGVVANGASPTFTVTVMNGGDVAATGISESGLTSPFMFAGGTYPGTGGTCPVGAIPAQSSCDLVVSFSPVASSAYSSSIDLNYNDGIGAALASFGLQGTGASPAVLTISESDPYNYGSIPIASSGTHVFVVTNSGGVSAAITINTFGLAAPYNFTGASYPGTSGDCGTTLASGSFCNIEIEFDPTATGVFNETLQIDYNDGVVVQSTTRDLTGTGTP